MQRDDHYRLNQQILARVRELRQPQTPAESRLWLHLRDQRLGYKFRRQHPIDRFIVDFYCASCSLIIEVDGDSHIEQADYDAARTEWLEQHGYHVIRFTNADVHHRLNDVLEAIVQECQKG